MERSEYLKEVEFTLKEIIKDEELVKIIKHSLEKSERELSFNSYRYGMRQPDKSKRPQLSEESYNKIIKVKKARNLIDYLILLRQNKDK
tara:strand:+ start:4005 stop:4271 length:267 start_codon:yes stop_codon:yes gene_type:complete